MPIHVTTSTIQSLSNKTFVDLLSTTGVVYANQGNSNQWNSSYSTVAAQSASNASVFATVQANSATSWNYQGTDIKALTGAWQSSYTTTNTQSSNNASVYATVQANSAAWAVSGSGVDTDVRALTANWQSTYSTVQANSSNWNIQPLRVSVPFSDQTSNLTTGTKYTFTWRYGSSTLSATPVDLVEAPTGSSFVINVTKNASSIYSVKPSIDAGETSTDTATTVAVITAASFSNGDIVTVSIDQVGVTNTGKGAIITFVGTTIV